MPEETDYHDDELFSSLLVPGHDCGADVGLTDVPAWTPFCRPCARTGGDLPAFRHAAAA